MALGMSVKRAQREIDAPEFAEWMAFSLWEPFGSRREDDRAGMVAALIANVNRDPKQRREPFSVEDFFPPYDTHDAGPEDEVADLEAKLRAWAVRVNAQQAKPQPETRPKKG